MIPFILAAVGGYLIGDSIGEDKKIPKFAEGGTIELYYVQDANGNVKNISKNYEDADRFLEKSLKFNGDIRVSIVPKEDWEKEKVSISNIKRYADGGMMADGGSIKTEDERYSYPDFYKSQGGFKFKTIEEAKKFIKGTNPFVRKQLKLGNAVLAFNGEEYYIAEKIKVNDEYAG